MITHQAQAGHRVCECGGYDYPHRPLSPYCHRHPHSSLLHALRLGDMTAEEIQDVVEELAWGEGQPLKVWPLGEPK